MPVTPSSRDVPRAEYSRRLEAHVHERRRQETRHRRIADLRLALFVALAAVAWSAIGTGSCSPLWVLLPLAAFAGLVVAHAAVERQWRRAQRAVTVYQHAIARTEDRWAGLGAAGDRHRDPAHPYAEDLDLFGHGGLFQLLSIARTRRGEEILARWLLEPAPEEEARARREATAELRTRLDFREDLQVLGEDAGAGAGLDPDTLVRWAEEPAVLPGGVERGMALWLAGAAVALAVVWGTTGVAWPLCATFAVEAVFAFRLRRGVRRTVAGIDRAARDLLHLQQVLTRIEREPMAAPRLDRLRRLLTPAVGTSSARIAALQRQVQWLEASDSLLFRLLGPPLLYTTQVALALEAWRRANGAEVRRWLDTVGEVEALASLAGYAYENPGDPFPEVAGEGPCFEAEVLGHPLLPESGCVRNDVRLGGDLRVLLVSGSNMSGKSTLLRSIGVCAVMAAAGAPVRARRLRLSPLTVGASLRVTDSLQGGTSRFYAEILRLRRIFDLAAGPRPLLFLLDELLQGTNSHDRRIGAEGVVRGLVERGAAGLITTHDLALAAIVEGLGPRAANVHFADQFQAGTIRFDYSLRPGVVTKSNALELMRSIGLDV